MIRIFPALSVAALLAAAPMAMAVAAPGTSTTTPGTTQSTETAPSMGSQLNSPAANQLEQAQNSVATRDHWTATHPRKGAEGSSPTRSGMTGGGGR